MVSQDGRHDLRLSGDNITSISRTVKGNLESGFNLISSVEHEKVDLSIACAGRKDR
jgi:hypothetical protein